jgi:hypothetical protein
MSNHKNLIFFNKEGDYLNFNYNNTSDRFEGDILFHENSSDTYKTVGLYMLEKVPSFEFELEGELSLNKFQLFNEYGFDFYSAKYATQSVTKIEPINNDPNFYSKWIYGIDFESKFPIGTIIKFNNQFTEFVDLNQTYTVVSTKKGAIMIISSVDNATFESTYYSSYTSTTSYINLTISGVNAIGIYNYIDSNYVDNLSNWNESTFYDKLYNNKKLNIVNTSLNDGVVTVLNDNISDTVHFEYYTSISDLQTNQNLIIEVSTKTDLPKIYEGSINATSSKLEFGFGIPEILKPGREFKIVGSTLNQNFLSVSNIPSFTGNTQQTFYATQSQVMWNNKIYECIQAYTQSFSGTTQFLNPDNVLYWTSNITHITVDQTISAEFLSTCQVYLTVDKVYFDYGWTQSNSVTLSSAAEKYKDDLKSFNIDLYYNSNKLKADLIYPSKYVEVNFYHTQIGTTHSIGHVLQTSERMIGVKEQLNNELNYDISSNFLYNIVFTDLDEYGLKITINKQVYEEEINWVYSGTAPDMERTIDRTLRSWISRNYLRLLSLGIIAELQYTGSFTSVFYNSIKITTQYPNIPIILNSVNVGITADYHIEHSKVLFSDLGPYISININGDLYDQSTIYLTGSYSQYPDIPATLQAWVTEHYEDLIEYGTIVSSINNLLKFDVKRVDRRLDYTIKTGKLSIPGLLDYILTNKLKGSPGCLITSNEATLPKGSSFSFEEEGFSTGMAISINNTFYPYNNQEYNVQFLDPTAINLSYQGPFWGLNDNICNTSAFVTLAFNGGFGQTACDPIIGPTGIGLTGGGPFNTLQFSSAFSLQYNPNNYFTTTYNLSSYPGSNGLVDIIYIQLSNSIYSFGDNLTVMDSTLGHYLATVTLPGNTQSLQMEFNPVNNYLYCLSKNKIFVVDPQLNTLVTSMTFSNTAYDLEINTNNGDVYVTYENSPNISIYNYSNTLATTLGTYSTNFPPSTTSCGKMVFNSFEGDMYITTDASQVLRVNGSTPPLGNPNRTIQTTYAIPGATNSIFYEPVNEAVYVYGSASLWKIDNGVTYSLAITTNSFDDMIFNNLTGEMNLSDSSTSFRSIDLNTGNISVNSGVSNYGYLALNQFDGDVYLSSLSMNNVVVIRAASGAVVHTEPMISQTTKIIYNPDRKSVFAIQPSLNSVIEIGVNINATININTNNNSEIGENLYGTLDPNYVPHPGLWLKAKEYVRKPRENFEGETQVSYYWRWFEDTNPEFFIYDFSGTQLTTSGSYSYLGEKPLSTIVLNKKPNKDLNKIYSPEYQQTVFDRVEYPLNYIDDSNDITIEAESLELFLGYKSTEEGSSKSTLQLYKKEDVSVIYESTPINDTILSFETLDANGPDKRGQIKINSSSSETFLGKGFKEGQRLVIYVKDVTNIKSQYISYNNGVFVKIRSVFFKTIIVDFYEPTVDFLETELTVISNYPTTGLTTYCKTTLTVLDREIGRFLTYGQTEIEDIRFKTELGNLGKLITENEVFIFKDYDILEGGVDWPYLNMKRKEMLMMKHLIYPYIGSYKSIINAINFFGYNDLQLNEYYKDINPSSEKFLKLFKVEIPDIFDNTVEGWTESEFIMNNFPNDNYEETNMFNLTYKITDTEGNKVINYSIDEIVIKLQGLKYWLKKNIIPLTHKILDITGRSYFKAQNEISHTSYDVRFINNSQNMTPITLKLNEAYLMPINSGSTVYNCVVDFYTILDGVGADKNPTGLTPPPKPFNGVLIELPDYFNILVRTYKTYKEWVPFTTYSIGDKITYYGKLYESVTDNNKINNPRKYENVNLWLSGSTYLVTNLVEYDRDVFVYSGISSGTVSATSSIPPVLDPGNWLKTNDWREIDYEPVQTINEFRSVPKAQSFSNIIGVQNLTQTNPILPFNFTIDSNIDPFVVIEVTSDNGYGLIYRDRKNYEIRGLKDLRDTYTYIDPIGPFQPITPIY